MSFWARTNPRGSGGGPNWKSVRRIVRWSGYSLSSPLRLLRPQARERASADQPTPQMAPETPLNSWITEPLEVRQTNVSLSLPPTEAAREPSADTDTPVTVLLF